MTTLVGEATVTRASMAQDQALKKRDDVFLRDRISTGEHSLVHVLMGGKALLTVRELSVLTVTEDGGRAIVNLQSGKVGLAVVRERMRPGEVIEVHTPHAVAAVRGTVLVVEIVPGSADQESPGTSTNVHLLHGKLDVFLRSNPAGAPVQLETLQSVTVSGHKLGAVRPLSQAGVADVTANLNANKPARTALPEKFQSALGDQQRVLAIATAEGAAGSGRKRDGQGVQARAAVKSRGIDPGSVRDAVDVVSDAGDGAGAAAVTGSGANSAGGNSGSRGGSGDGDRSNGTGNDNGGRGRGFASSSGGGNGQAFGPGPGPVGNGLATVVPSFRHRKGN